MTLLDYETVCVGDKFENISILRSKDIDSFNSTTGSSIRQDLSNNNNTLSKFENICNFHVGQLVTCVAKTSLNFFSSSNYKEFGNTVKRNEVVIYATSLGTIGIFYPLETKDQVEFFSHLEMYMRIEQDKITGRDHKAFRSLFSPVKCVIDGDLISEFYSLDESKQNSIASELGSEYDIREVSRKIDALINKAL